KLADSEVPKWWRVNTTLNGSVAEGFVNSKFLSPSDGPAATAQEIVAVDLPTTGMTVTRANKLRAHPLTETPPIKRKALDPAATRVSAIRQLIDWFKVESSARYLASGGATFCNIYAYDYCFMTEAYLPRVWWTTQALLKLQAGKPVPIEYGETVEELTANSLNNWFKQWGEHFGWRRVFSLTELQDAANQGKVCITVARAKQQFHHGHGHIVAVVPENDTFRAQRHNGEVLKTVQSQAGGHNHDYVVQRWWDDGTYADFGHWVHD
ncbi:MAG TPA: hypothetical protein VGP59_04775, partial [Pyrinomonadaceae bacterium]|nr:hypothetical protein [Pyrinomonadaceae bacterium]